MPAQIRQAFAQALPALARIVAGADNSNDVERRRRAGRFAGRWRGILSVPAHIQRQELAVPNVDWPRNLTLVAIDADSGERVLLDATTGVGLGAGLAASRAMPGLVEPVAVDGRRLIDGSIGSATNADLLPAGVELGVVVTAIPAQPQPGSLDEIWADALTRESRVLAGRGVRVTIVTASPAAVEAMGGDPMDATGAREAVASGVEQGRVAAGALRTAVAS
jgi:NTE family protein